MSEQKVKALCEFSKENRRITVVRGSKTFTVSNGFAFSGEKDSTCFIKWRDNVSDWLLTRVENSDGANK